METMSSVVETSAFIEDPIMAKPEIKTDEINYLSHHLRSALSVVNCHIFLGNAKEAEEVIMDISKLLSKFGI